MTDADTIFSALRNSGLTSFADLAVPAPPRNRWDAFLQWIGWRRAESRLVRDVIHQLQRIPRGRTFSVSPRLAKVASCANDHPRYIWFPDAEGRECPVCGRLS